MGGQAVDTNARVRGLRRRQVLSPPRSGCATILLTILTVLPLPGGCNSAAGATLPGPSQSEAGRAAVTIAYGDLVDSTVVTRTGQRLADAVRDPRTPRAYLQPFLDSYSSLLPYVLEMARGADPVPRRDILERWPAGSPQPAWVALFRGGRYRAVADGEGRVSLFLPGDEAAAAWRQHYSVVRHCLAALAAAAGAPLAVEIFAYRNDYRRQELVLDLRPVRFAGSSFPPRRAPLAVGSLEEFFRTRARLEGAQLDPAAGLVLYGNPAHHDTLAGEPVSLADLVVAYRAVFHAGDNDAFISLDPHADPGVASVNFGGWLEDTRLGAAALSADRIFKTIASGLDPVSFRDRRTEIRNLMPTFLTNSERRFLDGATAQTTEGVQGRCWFYPDSISVDSDPVAGFAVITRPQFTAATERLGKGFENAPAAKKRAAQPPWLRENIRRLNADYALFSRAFPEIGDLAPVARLMAIAAWLRRSDTSWLDLDALLAVELPAVSTPRTLQQLISTEYISVPASEKITETNVKSRSGVIWLTPILQRSVGEIFGDPQTLADYLCAHRKPGQPRCSRSGAEDATLFEASREKPLRSLLGAGGDSVLLLEFLSSRLEYPSSPEAAAREAEQLAGITERHHDGSRSIAAWRTKSSIQMHGGISLSPADFSIRTAAESPALRLFKQRAKGAASATAAARAGGSLVRSNPSGTMPRAAGAASPGSRTPAAVERAPAVAAVQAAPPRGASVDPALPDLVSKSVSLPAGVVGAAGVRGELGADGRIVFRNASP